MSAIRPVASLQTTKFTGNPELATLTPRQAAEYLQLPVTTVYDLCRRGDLPSLKLGRRVLIPKARLDEMLGIGSAPTAH